MTNKGKKLCIDIFPRTRAQVGSTTVGWCKNEEIISERDFVLEASLYQRIKKKNYHTSQTKGPDLYSRFFYVKAL